MYELSKLTLSNELFRSASSTFQKKKKYSFTETVFYSMPLQKTEPLISSTDILSLHSIFIFLFLQDPEKNIGHST